MIRSVRFAVWSVVAMCTVPPATPAAAYSGGAAGMPARSVQPADTPPDRATPWREDLRYLADELPKRHLDAFHDISKEEWERRVAELDRAIPTLEDHQVVARLAALVAAVGDAHTSLNTRALFGQYPLQLKAFPDGVYVIGATPGHADLLGTRLVSIDGTDADRAREAVGAMATRENEVMHGMQTTRLLAVPEALHAFGVAKSVAHAEFTFARGEDSPDEEQRVGSDATIVLTPLDPGKPVSWKIPDTLSGDSAPIYLRDQALAYWWAWLDNGAILYVAYNRCASDAERPFQKFATEVMAEIQRTAEQQNSRTAEQQTPANSQEPTANSPSRSSSISATTAEGTPRSRCP